MSNSEKYFFSRIHPTSLAVFFVAEILLTMFLSNPVMLCLSFFGAVCLYSVVAGGRAILRAMKFYLPFFLLIAVSNPFFSHNGVTPLFFMNGKPITLEAIYFGVNIAVTLLAVVFWCKCWGEIMTSDKLLYLFGGGFPSLALVLSMSLRFIPLFKRRWAELKEAQTAMGFYSAVGLIAKLKSGLAVFSALVTRALESTVETGMSMKARGYGLSGKSRYTPFRFSYGDGCIIAVIVALCAVVVTGIAVGVTAFSFYPSVKYADGSFLKYAAYFAFGVLSFLPFALETREVVLWKYLKLRI